jgi:hypothetical protein
VQAIFVHLVRSQRCLAEVLAERKAMRALCNTLTLGGALKVTDHLPEYARVADTRRTEAHVE